tara:strand:+ start:1191 stop:1454 length:264 start_codon:yes stop_codon:yes gene_type:complete
VKLAIAAAAALTLALPVSATASEKMDLTFKKMEDGTYCGKYYSNRWTERMTYQCHTREVWEKKGVNFPAEVPVTLPDPEIDPGEIVA